MDTGVEIAVLVVLLALVLALLVFASILRDTAYQLQERRAADTEAQARLEVTLARMEAATVVVADNLADSVSRADATIGPDGAAADAALRTGDSASAITQRQDEARGN